MEKLAHPLSQVIERLALEFKPEKIILFGSRVWGAPNSSSDWDLLVVVNSSDLAPTRRAARAYRCLNGLRIPVEIIVSTRVEIEQYRSVYASLTNRILTQGQVLYG
jgi:predicted nucleotidyltransferase